MSQHIAVVTGGNRGIGLEVCGQMMDPMAAFFMIEKRFPGKARKGLK